VDKERSAWIFLNHIPYLGPMRFHRLLQFARSAEAILELPAAGLMAADVPPAMADSWYRAIRDRDNRLWLDRELERLERGEAQAATELDESYPSQLRELSDRPPVIFYKGRWPLPGSGLIGLVGTRQVSPYGRSVSQRISTELSIQGLGTVSGLARGVDTCVHQSTLDAGGHTIAVLGCGLGHVFPRENAALQEMISRRGTLISEFDFDTPPDPRHFPRRNRIIAGLADGVVVIEAGEASGALITARNATEQGRDVFAVPGNIFSAGSRGCHRLIKQGAKLVENTGDILEELGIARGPDPKSGLDRAPADFDKLTELDKQIFQRLSDEPLSADELALGTARRFNEVAQSLLTLELKGLIRAYPGQRYGKN
jgi:DNA processing protein